MTVTSPPSIQGRVAWIDVARAIAILLVVFFHVSHGLDARGWAIDPLPTLNWQLSTFRMPLFFVVSGILASNHVYRLSLKQLFWRRIVLLLWVYTLWSTIRWSYYAMVPLPYDDSISPNFSPLTAFVVPTSVMWFLYALVLYLLAAWCLRRLPTVVQLGLAACVSLAFATELIKLGSAYTWTAIGTHLVFFIAGTIGSQFIRRLADRVTVSWFFVSAVVFAGGTILRHFLPIPSVTMFIVAVAGAAFGICLAVMLSRVSWIQRPLSFIGARTLPIYVTHALLISGVLAIIPVGSLPAFPLVAVLWFCGIALGLAMDAAFSRVPGIFTLPPGLDAYANKRAMQ